MLLQKPKLVPKVLPHRRKVRKPQPRGGSVFVDHWPGQSLSPSVAFGNRPRRREMVARPSRVFPARSAPLPTERALSAPRLSFRQGSSAHTLAILLGLPTGNHHAALFLCQMLIQAAGTLQACSAGLLRSASLDFSGLMALMQQEALEMPLRRRRI